MVALFGHTLAVATGQEIFLFDRALIPLQWEMFFLDIVVFCEENALPEGSGSLSLGRFFKDWISSSQDSPKLSIARAGHSSCRAYRVGGHVKLVGFNSLVVRWCLSVLRSCYEREFRVNLKVVGRFVLKIRVGDNGWVMVIKVFYYDSSLGSVDKCVIAKVRRWCYSRTDVLTTRIGVLFRPAR